MQVTTIQGDTLDLLCWRSLGRTEGVVEATLDRNPHLAALHAASPVLPLGTVVDLAEPATLPAEQGRTVNLWD